MSDITDECSKFHVTGIGKTVEKHTKLVETWQHMHLFSLMGSVTIGWDKRNALKVMIAGLNQLSRALPTRTIVYSN